MEDGIITLLDILGWKGAWQKQDAQNPMASLQSLLEIGRQICEAATRLAIRQDTLPECGKFEVISISDTIAIVSQPAITVEQIRGQLEDHVLISKMLIKYSILHSIPLRGAISAGKFSKNGNTFIGPAVDEVAAWHEVGEWIGVMATPSILLRADEIAKDESSRELMVPFKVPTKGGLFETVCVDWPRTWLTTQKEASSFAKIFEQLETSPRSEADLLGYFLKMGPLTPDIYPKYSNTLSFFRHRRTVFDKIND